MKYPILASVVTLGLACIAGASAAQEATRTTNLKYVTVTGTPTPYEIYVVDLDRAYGLQVLVGNNHKQYMHAQRAADRSEALRKQGISQGSYVAVAIDNSSGPGVARQIQLSEPGRGTVAIVDVYCKAFVHSGGDHCTLAPWPRSAGTEQQRMASRLPATGAGEGG